MRRIAARILSLTCFAAASSIAAAQAIASPASRPSSASSMPANQALTSPPATQAAASSQPASSQPSSLSSIPPEFDHLFKQLADPDWRTRRNAREALVRLGENAKPHIEQLIRTSPNEETRHQAQETLALIEESRILGPSFITLHLEKAQPAEVFSEIARQCHAPLLTIPENLWNQGGFPPLTLDVDSRPFWEVLPGICRKFGVDFNQYQTNLRLMRTGGNQLAGLFRVEGAFLVVADRIFYSRTRQLGTGRAEQSNFSINFTIYPEPKITLLRGMNTLHLIEAIDDHGNSLLSPNTTSVSNGPFGGSIGAPISAALQYPKHNIGSKIVRFKANATFHVQTRTEQFQVPDVLKARDFHAMVHGLSITVKECRQTPGGYELKLSLVPPQPISPDFGNLYEQVQSKLQLLDAHGIELPHRGMSTGPNADRQGLEITLEFGRSSPTQTPDHILWEIPVESRKITIPINFTDIPLFDDN